MKEKIFNVLWVSVPIIMVILIIVSVIGGQKTVDIWNLLVWVLCVIVLQILILVREKAIKSLTESISKYEKLVNLYKGLLKIKEENLNDVHSTIKKYLVGDRKEVWNIIIQSFDKTGEEEYYTINSFVTESLARDKYHAWLEEDNANPDHNVEETPGVLEYWYTRESGEMTRVKVVKSYVFDSVE